MRFSHFTTPSPINLTYRIGVLFAIFAILLKGRIMRKWLYFCFILFTVAFTRIAYTHAQETGSPLSAIDSLLQTAEQAVERNDLPAAIQASNRAQALCRSSSELSDRLPSVLFSNAQLNTYGGNYERALQELHEVLSLNSHAPKPDPILDARTYMQLGIVSFFQHQWDDALYNYRKAEQLANQLGNNTGAVDSTE